MNEEELKLLNEMKDNCIKQSNYIDIKAMDKYNLLRHIEEIINDLQKQNTGLKEENERLKKNSNPLKGIFAQVTDDTLLRDVGNLNAENKRLKNGWNELKDYLLEKILQPVSCNFLYDGGQKGYKEIYKKMQRLEEKEVE